MPKYRDMTEFDERLTRWLSDWYANEREPDPGLASRTHERLQERLEEIFSEKERTNMRQLTTKVTAGVYKAYIGGVAWTFVRRERRGARGQWAALKGDDPRGKLYETLGMAIRKTFELEFGKVPSSYTFWVLGKAREIHPRENRADWYAGMNDARCGRVAPAYKPSKPETWFKRAGWECEADRISRAKLTPEETDNLINEVASKTLGATIKYFVS